MPLNLGQTGDGVERHESLLWLRCKTDKALPLRPQHDGKPSSMHRESRNAHAHLHGGFLCSQRKVREASPVRSLAGAREVDQRALISILIVFNDLL